MKDVAKAAGVSVMTVSRAFKDHTSVKGRTREHIRQTASEMGYVFDSTAANLRTQRSNFIAVVIPSLNNANFADTIDGLSGPVEASGRQILLGNSNYDIDREERLVEQLLQRRPEAIVLTGGRHTKGVRSRLSDGGLPVVEMWDLPANPIGHVVGFDNASTMKDMVGHLVASGHERIGFIGGDAPQDARGAHRRIGFVAAMEELGLSARRLVGTGTPPISMREGALAMGQLLEQLPDTDAVICVSDLTAFGALTECMRRGVAVPDDMAIAGFGAYEIASVCVPALTTIDPHPREIGRRTGELIVSLLDNPTLAGETVDPHIVVKIPTDITPGGSAP
ncbi:MAG: LacI family DNA-binding transcriptional regulator [Hyphomicrobiaceae bacterium]|nr:LacI family DNA-binding transcriptional regulator [Hyphomicrobiaceae bacterium]